MRFRQIFLLHLLLISSLISFAQSGKFYRIEYDVDLEGAEDVDPTAAAMMEDMTMVLAFQGDKARVEMGMQMMDMRMVYDQEKKYAVTLMNMMGQGTAQIYEGEAFDNMQAENEAPQPPKVRETGKTKTIAGYTCRQAFLTQPGDTEESEIWYAPDILVDNNSTEYNIANLPGFPLEMTMKQQGMMMQMNAVEVSTEVPAEDYFSLDIPEGYVIQDDH